jgi:osmoprotectant transport system substrate-binding protein
VDIVRRRRVFAVALMAAFAVLVAACGGTASQNAGGVNRSSGSKGSLTVADAGFTESEVLANMYADVLAKAGYKTNETSVKSSEIFQSSLEKGDVAVVPEYVATYADQLNRIINGANAASVA